MALAGSWQEAQGQAATGMASMVVLPQDHGFATDRYEILSEQDLLGDRLVRRRQSEAIYWPWAVAGLLSVGPAYSFGLHSGFAGILSLALFAALTVALYLAVFSYQEQVLEFLQGSGVWEKLVAAAAVAAFVPLAAFSIGGFTHRLLGLLKFE